MITNSIHILFPVLLFLFSLIGYKAAGKRISKFYVSMAQRHSWRRFYTLMLLLILLLFHFNYVNIAQSVYDLAPSSIAFIFLFSHGFTERIIYYLQNRRTLFVSAIIALICGFIPFFLSTAVTIEALLFGAIFYPSRKVRERISFPNYHKEIMEQPGDIRYFYYDWND
ncbi:hypothetical protein [Bacteroides sp. 51]|uniref:hypothetical protein n=1 Tax=Bacteroides sp. 51 TaxID=2302938 RepID=UPI0013D6C66F|nr:hypothetical protein [Bacteroides sp. 51]NDV84765.1 hypothetical protein [Bacteroides sp. 51]